MSPPGPGSPQPLAFHPGLSLAPPAPHPRLFPALSAPHSSPRAVPGRSQPLAPYPGLSPKCPQPGLSPPPRAPPASAHLGGGAGRRSAALCACRAAALPGPAGPALWCGRKGPGRERKRRRAGERWRHRLQRGRERRGILRGVAAAGPLLRGRPVWIRVLCCGEGGALAGGGCGTLPKGRCARLRRVRRKVTPYSSGGGTLYLREQSVSVCLGGTLPLDPST